MCFHPTSDSLSDIVAQAREQYSDFSDLELMAVLVESTDFDPWEIVYEIVNTAPASV